MYTPAPILGFEEVKRIDKSSFPSASTKYLPLSLTIHTATVLPPHLEIPNSHQTAEDCGGRRHSAISELTKNGPVSANVTRGRTEQLIAYRPRRMTAAARQRAN